ncbi:MAG TPA: DUF3426 domain-containing protein, partial [Gammaproteobacteria bacterium]|nr:DUF3426 domain-containing protein [Gammaproteobacteria bacterium]
MYTQCPQCSAIFQLSASQLKAANGEVRCGQCLSVFNALDHLSEDVPHGQEIDTTAQLAEEAQTYQQWTADSAHTPVSPAEENGTEPSPGGDNEDVFREVMAEVSNHPIPEEAIEEFEEFLDSDTPPMDPGPDTTVSEVSDESPADSQSPAFVEQKVEESAEGKLAQTPEPANEPGSESTPVAIQDLPPDGSPAVFTIDESDIPGEDTPLGDVEEATPELDTHIPVDDDEFAELNAFLNEDEDARAEAVLSLAAKAEGQPIIIEETDLPSVDAPGDDQAPPPASPPPAQDREEASPPPDTIGAAQGSEPGASPSTPSVPSVILDELHAAKAERLRPSNTPWVIGSLLLMLTLVVQVTYHSRDDLARDPALRPWLIKMCNLLHCTLSQPYDIKQIEIIGRDVRSHPSAHNALIVSTTLINNADFVQPFPLLTMVFSDINGKKIAQRRFTP